MTQQYYYLSIGSNVDPEKNAPRIIAMLAERFGPLVMYPFFYTAPVDIDSDKTFLNSLAVVLTSLTHSEVKQALNAIEIALGRDRRDPLRSSKDRCADIDILAAEASFNEGVFKRHSQPYIAGLIGAKQAPADLSDFKLPATKGAATVDLDTSSGHVRVLDDTANRLEYWQKSALSTE